MAQYTFDFRRAQTVEDLKIMLNRYFETFFESLDSTNVKKLFTEQCLIRSKDGNTELNGTQVIMKDGNTTIRLIMGLDKATGKFTFSLKDINGIENFSVSDVGQIKLSGKPLFEMYDNNNILRLKMGFNSVTSLFVFEMFDNFGNLSIGLSSSGGAMYKGDIQTDKDIKVGNNIQIGYIAQADVAKKIIFYSNGTDQSYIEKDASNDLNVVSYKNIDIQAFIDMTLHCLGFLAMSGYTGFALTTTDTASTDFAKVLHDGAGNFELGHSGTGQVLTKGTWECNGSLFNNLRSSSGYYATLSDISSYVSGLQSQINSLESRVSALESAPTP